MENLSDLRALDLNQIQSPAAVVENLFPSSASDDQSRQIALIHKDNVTGFQPSLPELHSQSWFSQQPKCRNSMAESLTDEDLDEFKGCIELGFGFGSDEDRRLCETLPALNLYYAINRRDLNPSDQCFGFPRAADSGDGSEVMKTRLKHWAQIVACSVMQSYQFAKFQT